MRGTHQALLVWPSEIYKSLKVWGENAKFGSSSRCTQHCLPYTHIDGLSLGTALYASYRELSTAKTTRTQVGVQFEINFVACRSCSVACQCPRQSITFYLRPTIRQLDSTFDGEAWSVVMSFRGVDISLLIRDAAQIGPLTNAI